MPVEGVVEREEVPVPGLRRLRAEFLQFQLLLEAVAQRRQAAPQLTVLRVMHTALRIGRAMRLSLLEFLSWAAAGSSH